MMNAQICKVLQDPKPTTDARSERYLAVALGYPSTWRVQRRLIPINSFNEEPACMLQDIIYAGNPKKGVDRWFTHEAAQVAATEYDGNPYQFKGGHMLKKEPKFAKGDTVEVKYGKKWYDAKILKRKEYADGIKYSVAYTVDDSTQNNVRETSIRLAPPDNSALNLAISLGFPPDWRAVKKNSKILYYAPDGTLFRSKAKALAQLSSLGPEEDPPWRTSGHEWIGSRISYSHTHKLGRMRSVNVEQVGKVVGWISENDQDRNGDPGYVSEKTGKPAALFHVVFPEEPSHAYPKFLVDTTDMEEEEVQKMLLDAIS